MKLTKKWIFTRLGILALIIIVLLIFGVKLSVPLFLLGVALILLFDFVFFPNTKLSEEGYGESKAVSDWDKIQTADTGKTIMEIIKDDADVNELDVVGAEEVGSQPIEELVTEAKEKIAKDDKRTITQKVLDHLESGKTITSDQCKELFDYDRLNAIVYKLKNRKKNKIKVLDWNDNYTNSVGKNVAYKVYGLELSR